MTAKTKLNLLKQLENSPKANHRLLALLLTDPQELEAFELTAFPDDLAAIARAIIATQNDAQLDETLKNYFNLDAIAPEPVKNKIARTLFLLGKYERLTRLQLSEIAAALKEIQDSQSSRQEAYAFIESVFAAENPEAARAAELLREKHLEHLRARAAQPNPPPPVSAPVPPPVSASAPPPVSASAPPPVSASAPPPVSASAPPPVSASAPPPLANPSPAASALPLITGQPFLAASNPRRRNPPSANPPVSAPFADEDKANVEKYARHYLAWTKLALVSNYEWQRNKAHLLEANELLLPLLQTDPNLTELFNQLEQADEALHSYNQPRLTKIRHFGSKASLTDAAGQLQDYASGVDTDPLIPGTKRSTEFTFGNDAQGNPLVAKLLESYRDEANGSKTFIAQPEIPKGLNDEQLKTWARLTLFSFRAAAPASIPKFEDGFSQPQLEALIGYCECMGYPYDLGAMQKLRIFATALEKTNKADLTDEQWERLKKNEILNPPLAEAILQKLNAAVDPLINGPLLKLRMAVQFLETHHKASLTDPQWEQLKTNQALDPAIPAAALQGLTQAANQHLTETWQNWLAQDANKDERCPSLVKAEREALSAKMKQLAEARGVLQPQARASGRPRSLSASSPLAGPPAAAAANPASPPVAVAVAAP